MADPPLEPFPIAPGKVEHPAPVTAGGDPLGGATHGEVGGSRHYTGQGLGPLVNWKCPSCAQDNTGPFAAGCVHCGSGSAAPKHIGVPPPPPSKTPARIGQGLWEVDRRLAPPLRAQPPVIELPMDGFDRWFTAKAQGNPGVSTLRNILAEAWAAALQWYGANLPATESPAVGGLPVDTRVPVPRALLEKVIAILDVTYDLPDEQQSEDLLLLISQLREILE